MTIAGQQPQPPSQSPAGFDPAHPNLAALAWNPSYAEARQSLMHDLYGTRYDNVPLAIGVSLPTVWPGWATLVGVGMPAAIVVGAVALISTGHSFLVALGQMAVIAAVILSLIVVGLYAIIRYFGRISAEGWRRVKLECLARVNGLLFLQRGTPPLLPGCVFTVGVDSPYVQSQFSTATAPTVLFGNFNPRSTPTDGPRSAIAPAPEKSWGFLAIQLQRSLPDLLLISQTREPGEMALPVVPRRGDAVSLEGDFDRYFTLYCPSQRKQEALYVITPDLMALLIDRAAPFDVEIADDWMFFYSRIPFDMLDAAVYQRLFGILQTIGGKVSGTSSRYVADAE